MRRFLPWKLFVAAASASAVVGCCCPPPCYQCGPLPPFQCHAPCMPYNAAPYAPSTYGTPCMSGIGPQYAPCVSRSPGTDRLKISGDGNSVVAYDEDNGKMFVWQKGQPNWEPVPRFPFQ
jgi:hypothetical protein